MTDEPTNKGPASLPPVRDLDWGTGKPGPAPAPAPAELFHCPEWAMVPVKTVTRDELLATYPMSDEA